MHKLLINNALLKNIQMSNYSRRKTLKIIGTLSFTSLLPFRSIGNSLDPICDVCKEAWNKLSRFTGKRYQFRYIEPNADLPKVFIYGDSISIAYTEYVRASLEGKAGVYRLHENGSSSDAFIDKMETVRKAMFQPELKDGWDFEWDLIYFNVGLHDLKYILNKKLDKEDGKQVASLTDYEQNLQSIIAYLKDTYPKAKLIFATTTPVPEGAQGRIAGDAKRYNEVALKVMKQHKGIEINDLYEFSIDALKDYATSPGNVHFNKEGARLQGIEVARMIADSIGVEPNDCPSVAIIEERFRKYEQKN